MVHSVEEPLDDLHPPALLAGIYRHYKGPFYKVKEYSHNASDGDRLQISYDPLELDGAHAGARAATRNYEEFADLIHPDGFECLDGKCGENLIHVRRFTYLGPVFTADMVSDREPTYTQQQIEEIDRNARAYGWEVGRGRPVADVFATYDGDPENPFLDPEWREKAGVADA